MDPILIVQQVNHYQRIFIICFQVIFATSTYNVTNDKFNFLYRNGPRKIASFVVSPDGTGTNKPLDGCETSQVGGYDSLTNSIIGLGIYRNGTTIDDVYIAVTSTPLDGGSCNYTHIVLDEGTWQYGIAIDGIAAYDNQLRKLYFYSGNGIDPTYPLWLIEVDINTGKPRIMHTDKQANVPTALIFIPSKTITEE